MSYVVFVLRQWLQEPLVSTSVAIVLWSFLAVSALATFCVCMAPVWIFEAC